MADPSRMMAPGSFWKYLFKLCWLGHDHDLIVDNDARIVFNRCVNCGDEFQYDFQKELSPNWIGFCDPPHSCPLCFGWKPKDWDRCGNEICVMNPDGMLYLGSDGTLSPDLDRKRSKR